VPTVQERAEVTRVPPLRNEDGLIACECSACSYVTSVIWPADGHRRRGPYALPDRPWLRIDKGRPDYAVYSGDWNVGRIYETRGGPDNLRWF
jgi:hypothetical protein